MARTRVWAFVIVNVVVVVVDVVVVLTVGLLCLVYGERDSRPHQTMGIGEVIRVILAAIVEVVVLAGRAEPDVGLTGLSFSTRAGLIPEACIAERGNAISGLISVLLLTCCCSCCC